ILLNGYVGFSIALFFVIFHAPDLALTQLVIETVTTTLFLLCFYFLPDWNVMVATHHKRWFRLVVSILVGLVFTLVGHSVKNGRLLPSIASYYEITEELTGAKNMVNTILGDFRAFDTMLEVVVLFVAGIGIHTIVKFQKKKGVSKLEDK